MPRKPIDSDSSQKENAGSPVKVVTKEEKVRRGSRAAPLENGNRQRGESEGGLEDQEQNDQEEEQTTVFGDDDAENVNSNEDEDEGSPRGAKRARVEGDDEEGDEEADEEAQPEVEPMRPVTLPRDTDGYVPGSIVRVKLHNFVTYDDVEFRPGPYLNMILGPNGTGKSSIACALCLGLNFPPSVLGRAAEINKFVKHGYEEGFIEIELKGPKGQENLVIRRHIKRINRVSSFSLNGVIVTAKEVTLHVSALNVQVTNLCAFLPQDKVAEFAQMTPQQLLVQTQLAAGDKSLTTWHETLIKLGKDLKQLITTLNTEINERTTLEQRNALLERDVQLYKQREEIEKQVKVYQAVLPYKMYQLLKEQYDACKKKRLELHSKVKDLAEKNRPAHEFKAQLEEEHKVLDEERESFKAAAKEKFKQLGKKWDANEKFSKENDQLSDKMSSLKTSEKKRKENIQKLTKNIHKMEHELSHPPEVEDMAIVDAEAKTVNEQLNRVKQEKDDKESDIKRFVDDSAVQKNRIQRALNDIKNLDDFAYRRLEDLGRRERDIADAIKWLRSNQNRFKMEVVEPAIISMSVPDQSYAYAVEACIRPNQLRTFICQCPEDYTLLNRLFHDTTEALGRKIGIEIWFRPKDEKLLLECPIPQEHLHQEGFDKYAIDCVQCPDGLLWYLKMNCSFHRIPIARDASRVDSNRITEIVSRVGPGLDGSGSFIVGKVMNSVTRSRYGKRLPQNSTRDIRPPNTLIHRPLDQERKKQLEQEIAEARTLENLAEIEIKPLHEQLAEIEARIGTLSEERKSLDARRKAIRDTLQRIETTKIRLDAERKRLAQQEAAPSLDAERTRLRRAIFENAKKRASVVKDLRNIITSVIEDQTNATLSGLHYLQKGANKRALEELVKANDKEYESAREEFEKASREFDQVKQECKEKVEEARKKIDDLDDELRKKFEELDESGTIKETTIEHFEQELQNQLTMLEMNFANNPEVVAQYESRQREIASLTSKIETKERTKQKLDAKMKITKDLWLPNLHQLVANIGEKFSNAFDRVGCAGEIRIAEHEDYERWAIDILVKFRDSEKLQLLTGQRQSGGERALTTIMYLMSLTELARAPFSLVDEINQGMDANYERAVHNSLVEVTCRPDSGQYFLITPKLLTDLKYHERMKVLCVNNGEWLPGRDEGIDGSMLKMIDSYVAKRNANPKAA